ncbi:phosphodiester glycosidase family protein [candidate division KSB1 bacterium]
MEYFKRYLFVLFSILVFLFSPFISLFAQDISQTIHDGVVYREYHFKEIPQVIQVVKINRENLSIKYKVLLGGFDKMGILPLDKMVDQSFSIDEHPIAAINADFYTIQQNPFHADPVGLCIKDGQIISNPVNRSVFTITDKNEYRIDRFEMTAEITKINGGKFIFKHINCTCPDNSIALITKGFGLKTRPQNNSVHILTGGIQSIIKPDNNYELSIIETLNRDSLLFLADNQIAFVGMGSGAGFLENLKIEDKLSFSYSVFPEGNNIKHAVGGTPRLLRNGKISIENDLEGVSQSFVDTRHPRTAIGYNEDFLFFVTVDGRQDGYSIGMDLKELASFLIKIGAKEAINLDGGGSTTMWADGEIRNKPSDGTIRSIANGLAIYVKH